MEEYEIHGREQEGISDCCDGQRWGWEPYIGVVPESL